MSLAKQFLKNYPTYVTLIEVLDELDTITVAKCANRTFVGFSDSSYLVIRKDEIKAY